MKNYLVVFLLGLFLSPFAHAQQPVETGTIPISLSSGGGQYGSMFANLMNRRNYNHHAMLGTPYLNDEWAGAQVEYKGQLFRFDQVKVDILNNCLEIKMDGEEKILDAKFFKAFTLLPLQANPNLNFVNAMSYKHEGKMLTGFMKKNQVGEINILTLYKARVSKPRQDAKIVGQDPRDKIIQTQEIYLENDGRLHLVKNRKTLLAALRNQQSKAKKYMEENKVNPRDEEDLVKLLVYCQQ